MVNHLNVLHKQDVQGIYYSLLNQQSSRVMRNFFILRLINSHPEMCGRTFW